MPSSAYAIAVIVLAVIGFVVWIARGQRAKALLAARELEIRQIAKIHEEDKKIDEQTDKKLDEAGDPATDPRAMWLRDKKRVPDVPDPGTTGNKV